MANPKKIFTNEKIKGRTNQRTSNEATHSHVKISKKLSL